jgi:hypothetical protein
VITISFIYFEISSTISLAGDVHSRGLALLVIPVAIVGDGFAFVEGFWEGFRR